MPIIDRKFRLPRIWSNRELKKFAHLFEGDIANVSGWQDKDKEGEEYKSYFSKKSSYTITNYKTEARGYQGGVGEVFLDLEQELPDELKGRFDVVFNHTTLEHIFEIDKAFGNLCAMSRDVVILVMPFLQQMHTDYGDYWRMTPLAVERMFSKNGLKTIYLSFNDQSGASVYIFAIASKDPDKWKGLITESIQTHSRPKSFDGFENFAGSRALGNCLYSIKTQVRKIFGR